MGKWKILIERIKNDQNRMVSFYKRWKGLFNKAQELSSPTRSRTAFLVLSQADRPYVFRFSSFESIVEKFLSHLGEDVKTSLTDQTITTQSISENGDVIGCYSKNDDIVLSYLNQLLNVDFEELLALKDNLKERGRRVAWALDLQFVQSLFA